MNKQMPMRQRVAQLLRSRRSVFGASSLLIMFVVAVGMGLVYYVFLEKVQRPRIESVANSVSAYITGVRQFARVATPAQRAAFIDTLAVDSGVHRVNRLDARFEPPRGPLLPDFLAKLRANAGNDGHIAWHDGGGADQSIWFEVRLPDAAPIWLSYPARVNPISPAAVAALFGALFVLAIGAAALLQARLNPPLRALGDAAERLARGERGIELPLTGAIEMAELTDRFNQMARGLAEADTERTLLLAGISHDLRTPLTRMRLALALRDTAPGDESLVRGIEEIDAIIGQFVEFAGAGNDAEVAVRFYINHLVREVAASLELDGHLFELDLQMPPMVCVRPVAMQRVLVNLMGNAARYAGCGLAVSTRFDDGMVCVRVSDAGPGASPEELTRLGQPFVRTAAGRSKGPGSGLGLAIVHRLLEAEGGTLTLEINRQGGLDAVVRLPPVSKDTSPTDTLPAPR